MSQKHCTTKREEFQHFSIDERKDIERGLKRKVSIRKIAKALGRSPSSVSREIKRNSVSQHKKKTYQKIRHEDCGFLKEKDYVEFKAYFADTAHAEQKKRRSNRLGQYKLLKDLDLMRYIDYNILVNKYTPEAIINGMKAHGIKFSITVCPKTVYNCIERGILKTTNMDLPLKCRLKIKNKRIRENKRKLGKSIDERPLSVNDRKEFGHFEADSIIGKDNKSSILTLTEWKTRAGFIIKVNSKKPDETIRALRETISELPPGLVKSITFDNGVEFTHCATLEELIYCGYTLLIRLVRLKEAATKTLTDL